MAASGGVPPLLEARGATRRLPDGPVLVRDVNMIVRAGEFIAVTGPSGSGKSSLLYLLGLLDRPSEGHVLLEGQDTARLPASELAGLRLARLGFVFQFHFLLPEFTALDNVLIPIRRRGLLHGAAARNRAMALLDAFGLAPAAQKLPEQLSGGMRQRCAIARALANDPALILADEPTGNLDSVNAAAVFDIFSRLTREEGRAVVVVTHDAALAARASRRVHLVDGVVVSDAAQAEAPS
ncbi:ABC transporter ATP-binding protein [Falsiroseomonas frigidaquae]|uniref:ABC transporter ATP-binding protein n=1 Tax=Falsiroseomonas frigidaquae TaxID=487318 RepID=UPI001AE0B3C5|nr:ABC transporter ATP-binding protein [Falsiroseomonas frigidaquae]